MFDDNNDEIPLDEFGNPIYQSKIDPNDVPYADAMQLLKSINSRQQPQPIPLLQSLGKPANTAEEQDILSPIPQSKKQSVQQAKQLVDQSYGPSSAKAIIDSENPDNKVIDAGDAKTVASVENLKKLQEEANRGRSFNDAAQGFSMIGGSFASKDVRDDLGKLLDTKRAELDKPVKDYEQQIAIEKKDPNSPYSKGLKDYIKKSFGYEIKGDLSADDLKDTFLKPILTQYEGEEGRKSREFQKQLQVDALKANAAEKSADRRMQMDMMKDSKLQSQQQKSDMKNLDFASKQHDSILKTDAYKKLSIADEQLTSAESALRDPSGVKDVDVLYRVVRGFDPNSAVREGEIGLAKQAVGLMDSLNQQMSKLGSNPRAVPPQFIEGVKKLAEMNKQIAAKQYNRQMDGVIKNAKKRGLTEDDMSLIDPYYNSTFRSDAVGNDNSIGKQQTTVRVKKPDGTIGVIPVANLEKAKKQGYVEVK